MLGFLPTRAYRPRTPGATTFLSPLSGTFNYGWDSFVVHVLTMQANFNPALGLKERFGFHYWQLSFFDLDEEESFGTWFSSGILLMAAVLFLHQAKILRAQRGAW